MGIRPGFLVSAEAVLIGDWLPAVGTSTKSRSGAHLLGDI